MTGTDATALESHTPDTGGAGWTKHAISGGTARLKTNRVAGDNSECDYYHTATPGAADYDVSADLRVVTGDGYSGLIVRWDPTVSGGHYYGAGYDAGNGRWEIFAIKNGSYSGTLAFSNASLTVGNTYAIKLAVSGTGGTVALTFSVGGVSTVTYNDTAGTRITAAGKVGLYTNSDYQTNVGMHLDNLVGADATGGGTTGTGAVTFGAPALASSGAETLSGTGAVSFAKPTLASSGTETFTGTAAVVFGAPALSGSGTALLAITGTGAVAIAVPALAGSGATGDVVAGSGGVTLGAPTLTGTAAESFDASGGPTIGAPVLAGVGVEAFAGTGAVVIGVAGLACVGAESFSGTGAVTIGAPTLAGYEVDPVAPIEIVVGRGRSLVVTGADGGLLVIGGER